MQHDQLKQALAEIREEYASEPREKIPRIELLCGDIFVATIKAEDITYLDIQDECDWDDLMTLCWLDDNTVAGLPVIVSDWDGNEIHLSLGQMDPEIQQIFDEASSPSGTKILHRGAITDVVSWRGWTPDTKDSCHVYYSSWHVNDPLRIISLIDSGQQYPHQTLESWEVGDQHKRAVREWARDRYQLSRFEGLKV